MIVRLDVSRAEFEDALDRCWSEAVEQFARDARVDWRDRLSLQPSSGSQASDLILQIREHADPWSLFAGALLSQYVLPAVNRMLGRKDAVSITVDDAEPDKASKRRASTKKTAKKPTKKKPTTKTKRKK